LKKLNKIKYLLFFGLFHSEAAGVSTLSLSAVSGIDRVSGIAISADLLLHVVFQRKSVESRVDSRWSTSGTSENLTDLLNDRSRLDLIFAE
jgi:hypothetical protein